MFVSGDSFGGQKGFVSNSRAGLRQDGPKGRETIGETFLEEDDDSEMHESGEIDPRLFR